MSRDYSDRFARTVTDYRPPATSRSEAAVVGIAIVALAAGLIWRVDGSTIFTRPLWLDEWMTVLASSHGSPFQVLGDLRSGADGGASLLHLTVWAVYRITGSASPVMLRSVSLLFVLAALWVTYLVLRRRFGVGASLAGVIAAGSQQMVVSQAFQIRFYGLWLLCCALFAWSLSLPRRRSTMIAVTAVLVTTSHWYGVFSLGLMVAAAGCSQLPRWRDGLRLVMPGAAGAVAFAAILPLAAGQRGATTVNSWIPELSMAQVHMIVAAFWVASVPLFGLLGVVFGVARVWREGGRPAVVGHVRATVTEPGVAALTALGFMPVVLVALSVLGQPSMLERYGVPAALAWAPLVAFGMELLGQWSGAFFAVALTGVWLTMFSSEVTGSRINIARDRDLAGQLERASALRLPVVFASIHDLYPQYAGHPDTRRSVRYLDLPDSAVRRIFSAGDPNAGSSKSVRLERDFARVHARRYGFPVLATQADLDTVPRFVLVAAAVTGAGPDTLTALPAAAFPHHRVARMEGRLLLLERASADNRPERNTSR